MLAWALTGRALKPVHDITSQVGEISGGNLFYVYFGVLCFTTLVLVPVTAFFGVSREIDEGTWDLLAITTLSPASIVRGKVLSALIQTSLYVFTNTTQLPQIITAHFDFDRRLEAK